MTKVPLLEAGVPLPWSSGLGRRCLEADPRARTRASQVVETDDHVRKISGLVVAAVRVPGAGGRNMANANT